MTDIASKLLELGLVLPAAPVHPPGVVLPFAPVRILGDRAYISGHAPHNPDGTLAAPFGKVGRELTAEQGYIAARLTTLAMLGSLQRALGSLDRVTAWLRIFGMVNAAPGFTQLPAVINGASDLVLELWGPTAGAHARSAVGMSELPFNIAVEIEAEVAIMK
jgi:enamine deaminase RidA (YjgF/YER057c/UK114 family)